MSFLPQVSRHREGTVLDTYKWPATSHLVFPACLGGRTSLSPPMSQRGSATSPSNTVWCPGPASTSGESGPDLAGFFIPPWDPRLKFTPPPPRSGTQLATAPPSPQNHLNTTATVPTSPLLLLADNGISRRDGKTQRHQVRLSWWHLRCPLCVLWVA